jgi:hypothetical protein
MLPRLPRRGMRSALQPQRRTLALKNPHGPPKQKRNPAPILGTNKWTVDDKLTRSNKCDPYEQGGKPLPEEEARALLARGAPHAPVTIASPGEIRLMLVASVVGSLSCCCMSCFWLIYSDPRDLRPAAVGASAVHQHPVHGHHTQLAARWDSRGSA